MRQLKSSTVTPWGFRHQFQADQVLPARWNASQLRELLDAKAERARVRWDWAGKEAAAPRNGTAATDPVTFSDTSQWLSQGPTVLYGQGGVVLGNPVNGDMGPGTLNALALYAASLTVSGSIGMNGQPAPATPPVITGSRNGNAALTSLIQALAAYGLIVDNSTP